MYCVYLTRYSGNKLPRLYIGSSSIARINNGYRGSVESRKYKTIWKKEIKENPHLFKTRILQIFDDRSEATKAEYELQLKYNVINSPRFINMAVAAKNGYFGADLSGENNPNYGKTHSTRTRQLISEKRLGHRVSEETKIKISKSSALVWTQELRSRFSDRFSGSGNPNAGKYGKDSPNFGKKRTAETKKKQSDAHKGIKKTSEHVANMSHIYTIESASGTIFSGYGLKDFSEAIGLKHTTFFYTKRSKKFNSGYRIIDSFKDDPKKFNKLISFVKT